MSTDNERIASRIAHKIARQQQRRTVQLALGRTGEPGAEALSTIATRIAHIDGRIDGLTEALEVILGVEIVTYDVIERLLKVEV